MNNALKLTLAFCVFAASAGAWEIINEYTNYQEDRFITELVFSADDFKFESIEVEDYLRSKDFEHQSATSEIYVANGEQFHFAHGVNYKTKSPNISFKNLGNNEYQAIAEYVLLNPQENRVQAQKEIESKQALEETAALNKEEILQKSSETLTKNLEFRRFYESGGGTWVDFGLDKSVVAKVARAYSNIYVNISCAELKNDAVGYLDYEDRDWRGLPQLKIPRYKGGEPVESCGNLGEDDCEKKIRRKKYRGDEYIVDCAGMFACAVYKKVLWRYETNSLFVPRRWQFTERIDFYSISELGVYRGFLQGYGPNRETQLVCAARFREK